MSDPARTARNLLGPYESWMFGPGRVYDLSGLGLADQHSLSCVAEFPDGADISVVSGPTGSALDFAGLRCLIPTLYRPAGFQPRFVPFLMTDPRSDPTTAVSGKEIGAIHEALAGFQTSAAAKAATRGYFRLNFPVRAETVDPAFPASPARSDPQDPQVDPRQPVVILAIIDHGIPFAHSAFRHEKGTRIDYCWAQGADADGSGDVLFGREVTRSRIDEMTRRFGCDEDAIYREAGLLGRPGRSPMPLDGVESHGAHVLSLLAGNWSGATAAQVRIIAVDLPATSTWETSSFGTDMFMLAALHYIFERADRIAASCGLDHALPVVTNLSYGYSGGPQDMSGFVEAAMDELILQRRKAAPTALVMPSGNMFQDRLTAVVKADHFRDAEGKPTDAFPLQWFAPPDDHTSSFVELWYPAATAFEDIAVQVFAPGCDLAANAGGLTVQEPGRYYTTALIVGGKTVGQYAVDRHRDRRWRATVILAPTDPNAVPDDTHHAAPAGIWTLKLARPPEKVFAAAERGADGTERDGAIHCRIQIDTNSQQGNTGARQSCFVDPDYDPYDSDGMPAATDPADGTGVIRRFGSLNGMAANRSALVVAGYSETSRRPVSYSSAGALRGSVVPSVSSAEDLPGPGKQVHLSAPTDRSAWHEGILAAGTRSGMSVAMRGTSVAAPQAGRRLAEALLEGRVGETGDADNYLSLVVNLPSAGTPVSAAEGPTGRARLGQLRLRPIPVTARDQI